MRNKQRKNFEDTDHELLMLKAQCGLLTVRDKIELLNQSQVIMSGMLNEKTT